MVVAEGILFGVPLDEFNDWDKRSGMFVDVPHRGIPFRCAGEPVYASVTCVEFKSVGVDGFEFELHREGGAPRKGVDGHFAGWCGLGEAAARHCKCKEKCKDFFHDAVFFMVN